METVPSEVITPLINEKQAAKLLGISPISLRVSRSRKTALAVPFVRIGGAIRYRLEDIEQFIRANREAVK